MFATSLNQKDCGLGNTSKPKQPWNKTMKGTTQMQNVVNISKEVSIISGRQLDLEDLANSKMKNMI